MKKAQYIRFDKAVMGPGRGSNTIQKAVVLAPPPKKGEKPAPAPTNSRDEIMDEIIVGETWVLLKARRPDPFNPGRQYNAVRVVHASNVTDFEPAPELEEEDDKNEPAPELKKGTNR